MITVTLGFWSGVSVVVGIICSVAFGFVIGVFVAQQEEQNRKHSRRRW